VKLICALISLLADQRDNTHNDDDSKTALLHPFTPIPLYQTAGFRLLYLQKQLRDELAKCTAAVLIL